MTRTYGNRESCAACRPNLCGLPIEPDSADRHTDGHAFCILRIPACRADKRYCERPETSPQAALCLQCRLHAERVPSRYDGLDGKALARYPVEALGEWTWVLVRTEDWKQLLSERRFDPNHPAFSYLPKRETFLDGALVVRSSIRGVELSAIWHMAIEDLLDLAIRHELAHALCNDPDETKADRAAIALKNGTPLSCRVIEQASTANPK